MQRQVLVYTAQCPHCYSTFRTTCYALAWLWCWMHHLLCDLIGGSR